MGQELTCKLTFQRQTIPGKAYLETDFIQFRGQESSGLRLKIAFQDLTSVEAADGVLKLAFAAGPAALELGPAAEKWARKILNPPSRLDKLGLKPGLAAAVEGELEPEFIRELAALASPKTAGPKTKLDLLFFAAETAHDLTRVGKLASRLKPDGSLWIIYPKGITAIREIDVLQSGRAAGLKDTKVARFSATHTALKFVIPRASR
jgi:hypothetical protein